MQVSLAQIEKRSIATIQFCPQHRDSISYLLKVLTPIMAPSLRSNALQNIKALLCDGVISAVDPTDLIFVIFSPQIYF